jgi:lipoyl(octanoyl) transferase
MNKIYPSVIVRYLGIQDYVTCWNEMKHFTNTRDENTLDEIWVLQHPAVYTQGLNGKAEHILNPGNIPIIQTDRGGQITYHGPGQLVVYPLLDLRRFHLGIRDLVCKIEKTVVRLLARYHISAIGKDEARGVYVNGQKICSIGLRIRKHCSYHGLALNVAMDLSPFTRINPCGYQGLKMTQVSILGGPHEISVVEKDLIEELQREFGFNARLA